MLLSSTADPYISWCLACSSSSLFRAIAFLTLTSSFFLIAHTLVDRFIISPYNLPHTKKATLPAADESVLSSDNDSYLSELLPIGSAQVLPLRFRSASPEDPLFLERRLFYQNLNNSSQYLRRDSFTQ